MAKLDMSNKLSRLSNKLKNNDLDVIKKVSLVDINKIQPSNTNFYGIRDIDELAESIRLNGQLNPILLRRIDDEDYDYELIDGERRFTACQKLGLREIESIIIDENNDDKAYLLLIESNSQREKTPTEKAKEYDEKVRLYKKLGYISISSLIEEKDNISKKQQTRFNKVNELSEESQKALDNGDLTMRDIDKINVNKTDKSVDEQAKDILDEKEQSKTNEEIIKQKEDEHNRIILDKVSQNELIKQMKGFINKYENEDIEVSLLKSMISRMKYFIPKTDE